MLVNEEAVVLFRVYQRQGSIDPREAVELVLAEPVLDEILKTLRSARDLGLVGAGSRIVK